MRCLPTWPLELARQFGNLFRLRQQQQAYIVVDERCEDDDLCLDGIIGAIGTVISDARGASAVVAVHPVHRGARDQLEMAGGVGLRQLGDEDRRLRADVTAEGLT